MNQFMTSKMHELDPGGIRNSKLEDFCWKTSCTVVTLMYSLDCKSSRTFGTLKKGHYPNNDLPKLETYALKF